MDEGDYKSSSILRHGIFLILVTNVVNFLNFLFTVIMTRALGPENYGIFGSLLKVLLLILIPAGVVQPTIAKFTAELFAANKIREIGWLLRKSIEKLILLAVIISFLLLLFGTYLFDYMKITTKSSLFILIILMFFGFLTPVFRGGLQGLQNFTAMGLSQLLDTCGRLISGVILVILLGWGVNGALSASVFASLIGLLVAFFPLRDALLKKPKPGEVMDLYNEPRYIFPQMYRYALPVFLYTLALWPFNDLHVVIAKGAFESKLAGHYIAAQLIGFTLLALPGGFIAVMFPKVAYTHALQKDPILLIKKAILYSFILCILAIIVCVKFPHIIIAILFGCKYDTTILVPLIKFFAISFTPLALANVFINYHLAKADMRSVFLLLVFSAFHTCLLFLFHRTPYQLLTIILINGIILLFLNYLLVLFKKEK